MGHVADVLFLSPVGILFLTPAEEWAGVVAKGVECGGGLLAVSEPNVGMAVERGSVIPDTIGNPTGTIN